MNQCDFVKITTMDSIFLAAISRHCEYAFSERTYRILTSLQHSLENCTSMNESVVLLSGSYARMVPLDSSDVDLVVISSLNDNELASRMRTVGDTLGKTVFVNYLGFGDSELSRATSLKFLTSLPFLRFISGNRDLWDGYRLRVLSMIRSNPLSLLLELDRDIHRPWEAFDPSHPMYWNTKFGYGGILEFQYMVLLHCVFIELDIILRQLIDECLEAYRWVTFSRELACLSRHGSGQPLMSSEQIEEFLAEEQSRSHRLIIADSYRRTFRICWDSIW
jgi:hypothetical protein